MRLKPFLDDSISPQQFGFLKNHQILEPIAISQEVLHTFNSRKRCALILKMDLSKAFDRVNWTFIRLLLIQIGIPLVGVNWIMGCVTSAKFAVLVNGSPSSSFFCLSGNQTGVSSIPPLVHSGHRRA